MINLLQETIEAIAESGHTTRDVSFVMTRRQLGTWDEFTSLANFEYDNGYGIAEVDDSLYIVFTDNTWLERVEYDGSERWDYKCTPVKPKNALPLTKVEK